MKEKRSSVFTIANLVIALLCFAAFLVAGIGSYYLTVGEFVTARLWVLYIVLALLGAGSVFLHWFWFAGLYYAGCVLGWASGRFIGSLKGEFAPTAGLIVTFTLIAVFAVLGAILQWRAIRNKWAKRREAREAAKAQVEADSLSARLEEARRAKEAAEAAMNAAATHIPVDPAPGESVQAAPPAGESKTGE